MHNMLWAFFAGPWWDSVYVYIYIVRNKSPLTIRSHWYLSMIENSIPVCVWLTTVPKLHCSSISHTAKVTVIHSLYSKHPNKTFTNDRFKKRTFINDERLIIISSTKNIITNSTPKLFTQFNNHIAIFTIATIYVWIRSTCTCISSYIAILCI